MLSPVLCILPQERMLQIEIGRQRDPKESWREESQRSFYTYRGVYAEKSLHKAYRSCYTKTCLHRGLFTHRRVCTQGLLHREDLTQRSFLHTEGFTQRSVYSASCPFKKEPDPFALFEYFYKNRPRNSGLITPLPACLKKNLITSFRFVRILLHESNAQLRFDRANPCKGLPRPKGKATCCCGTVFASVFTIMQ